MSGFSLFPPFRGGRTSLLGKKVSSRTEVNDAANGKIFIPKSPRSSSLVKLTKGWKKYTLVTDRGTTLKALLLSFFWSGEAKTENRDILMYYWKKECTS